MLPITKVLFSTPRLGLYHRFGRRGEIVAAIPGVCAVRFGLKFSTSRPTDSIERWLERVCHARFEIRLDGVDVEKGRKDLLLVFEDATDRDRVKEALKSRAA